ncbi:hypothetical protein D7Y13_23425 [Corallococcus praedator]|uniref:Type VI secretion system baseplate subunit TssF n=1 Tax=Corallococcus praedator TaxID=2316724 RepID=A0ABX9QFT1_9BACT|nr:MULTISPECIES: type VI secretion system baseplate subunit TssF [Corallococcus]RKH25624.1 hypothetical protein D7X75_29705 [Corallococcus sp. CA031C]RKI02916.1 hypothetical protein D7Y13_23425 [Corallococcus praedator]
MRMDEALYASFLEELQALEKFRLGYTALHPSAPLDGEDADVRRLTEAMALFTARTRRAGQRALERSTLRLFQQHFAYLLNPVPAMAMLRAEPDARFVDAAELPRGTPFLLNPGPGGGPTGPLSLRTLAPVRLLPVRLTQARLERRGEDDTLLRLVFEGGFPRNDSPGEVRLHINHLNDFRASLAVFFQLKSSVRSATVCFDNGAVEHEVKPFDAHSGPVRLGAPLPVAAEGEPSEHPLQRLRQLLHFPQQELFLEARIPPAPRNWQGFTLSLRLSGRWPSELVLGPDSFVAHAVPVVNLQRAMATPVEHDGTKERHAVQHPDAPMGFRLNTAVGVYQLGAKGMQPLRPGAIAGGSQTYELENEGQGLARTSWLALDMPDAFMRPVRLGVDGLWHQPLPPRFDARGYRPVLADRFLDGVPWSLVGAVAPGGDNPVEHGQQSLLQLLALRTQRFLGREDLMFLLEVLGVRGQRHFRDLLPSLTEVSVKSKPFARSAAGFKYVYQVGFGPMDASLLPLVDLLCGRLVELLASWSAEDVVELEVRLPQREAPLRYVPLP